MAFRNGPQYPGIREGLVYCIDPPNPDCWKGSTTFYDLIGSPQTMAAQNFGAGDEYDQVLRNDGFDMPFTSDVYRQKCVFGKIALLILGCANLFSILIDSFLPLISMRFLAGIAAGSVLSLSLTALSDTRNPDHSIDMKCSHEYSVLLGGFFVFLKSNSLGGCPLSPLVLYVL